MRLELIRKAEDLIRGYRANGDDAAKTALTSWLIEKKQIADLHELCADKPDLQHLVVTPRFAEQFGLGAQVLDLIRKHRDFFSSDEIFLATGAYYSAAARSMFLLEADRYQEALSALPESPNDDCAQYALQRVRFSYGLHILGTGIGRPQRYLRGAVDLFEKAPRFEDDLIKKALNLHGETALMGCVDILTKIAARRPSKAIRQALSLVMTRRAIMLFNSDKLTLAVFARTMRNALDIDPENELALGSLHDTEPDLEIGEMTGLIDKHKMHQACRIARETHHHKVRDQFFQYMRQMLESLREMGPDANVRRRALSDISQWCSEVDEAHPLTLEIREMMERM